MEKESSLKEELTFLDKFSFGCGDLGINFAWASLGMFVTYFYTDVIGISALVVSSIMMFSRILDGVSDVAMGVIVDKTKSKYGKARPWLIWGGLPFALVVVSLFTVPDTTMTMKIVYVAISYNLLMLAYTAVAIPYGILNSMVTQDRHQREVLNVYRMFLALVGVLAVTYFTLPTVDYFGGGQRGWIITYAIFGTLSFLLFVFVFLKQRERVQPVVRKDDLPLRESIGAVFRNRYWVVTVLFFIVYSIGYAINQVITIYYAKYVLDDPKLIGHLTFAYTIPAMAGFLFLNKLFARWGKRKCMAVASVVSIGGYLLTMIDPDSFSVVMTAQVIKGIGQIPLLGGLWALLPDTIEYGEWKTGIRNEGLIYSGGSLGQKIGIGLGIAMAGYYMAYAGYDGTLAVQSAAAVGSIKSLFITIPIAIYILQIVLLYMNDLDTKYAGIVEELCERKRKAAGGDSAK